MAVIMRRSLAFLSLFAALLSLAHCLAQQTAALGDPRTRAVVLFFVASDCPLSNRTFPEIGISDGHHTVSHHGHDAEKIAAVKKIDVFHMQQYAYFLGKLKAVQEGHGTLLDNCMVLMGAGIADGDRHSHYDLPIILAGKAGGALKTGQHLTYPKQTPLCNLYLAMFDTLGVKAERFGDSNNRLQGLTA